jgi:hypothetical protein
MASTACYGDSFTFLFTFLDAKLQVYEYIKRVKSQTNLAAAKILTYRSTNVDDKAEHKIHSRGVANV